MAAGVRLIGMSAPRIRRKPERAKQTRAELDAILDASWMGTLSTIKDGLPLVVPLLYARDGDRLLLHGSTGAGAMRAAADGAPCVLSVTLLDGLVYAASLFDSSANYRSAVVPGTARRLPDDEAAEALDRFSDVLMPGRREELRGHLPKEIAATLVLELPIGDDWTAKQRTGDPGVDAQTEVWTGVLPVLTTYGEPQTAAESTVAEVSPSVQRLAGGSA